MTGRDDPGVIDISVTDTGKIKSHRLYWDTATVLAQLGLMPGVPT